ncbi:tetratricopeptide repeat protein [Actinokineospora sp.]|uniref:tetratricopeptide repeat protein n=1 Tax=Actinokineospora sp. TaxID=1872133 RepID=UPI00403797C4
MAVIERSVGEVALGLVGTAVGLLVGLLSLQIGMLVGALAFRARVHQVVVGIGTRLADWTTPRRVVVLRAVPLFLSVSVGPGKAPARQRMWGAALCSATAGVAAAGISVAAAFTATNGFTIGLGTACVFTVGHGLVPRKTPNSTSTGWLLVNLHRLTGVHAQRLDAAPMVGRTVDATQDGRLDEAAELASRLRDEYPTLRTATAARVLVLQAEGHYAEAMVLAMTLVEDRLQTPQEAAVSFAALAGLACATVEAGQLDSELGLSTAAQAIENAETLGYPTYKLNGSRALHQLLAGNTGQAISLARLAADSCDDLLGRADDLATLARAHMAAGDNRLAREVLAEAENLVPWWPRVAMTRSRLDIV